MYKNAKAYGFVDNIQELMSVSDMIVTKPGGLTISELLAMELPPIFISAIPGQEAGNIEALKTYGLGIEAESVEEVRRIALDYKENPDKLNSLKAIIKKIKKPYAAEELCNALCKDSFGPGS